MDEALCFGWIDGIRRTIDDDSYSIRFTPRRPRSIWSIVNINRANRKAWTFYDAQPPFYKKLMTRYVMQAKQEETRLRRLDRLIADSAAGRRVGLLERPRRRK